MSEIVEWLENNRGFPSLPPERLLKNLWKMWKTSFKFGCHNRNFLVYVNCFFHNRTHRKDTQTACLFFIPQRQYPDPPRTYDKSLPLEGKVAERQRGRMRWSAKQNENMIHLISHLR